MLRADHQAVIELLKSHKHTQSQIAALADCSVRTVVRIAKANGLSPGQGRRVYWAFDSSSVEIAYIIGLFLTEGTISFDHRTRLPINLTFSSTTPELLNRLEVCFSAIKLMTKRSRFWQRPTHSEKHNIHIKGGGYIEHLICYSSMFTRWLTAVCSGKEHLPVFLFDAPLDHQISTISAIIDGDGSVFKSGAIRVRNTCAWIGDFPRFLSGASIRNSGLAIERILPSGKNYYRVSIRRKDFRDNGGFCYHPRKQHRILHGQTDFSKIPFAPLEKTICPVCGQKIKRPESETCRSCYLKSDKFRDHLRAIAPAGNRAANLARWSKNH